VRVANGLKPFKGFQDFRRADTALKHGVNEKLSQTVAIRWLIPNLRPSIRNLRSEISNFRSEIRIRPIF
jgi:hypothetical protein